MLKNYRPLLLQDLGLSVGGLTVHQLRLNLHTPESVWTEHSHSFGQLLIYLAGRGRQIMGGRCYECRPGTVVFVKPQVTHAFEKTPLRNPLVLVLDLEIDQSRATAHLCSQLPDADLSRVRQSISRLFTVKSLEHRESVLLVSATVLEILDRVLRAAGWLRAVNRFGDQRNLALTRMIERLIERSDNPEITLEEMAGKAGYHIDVLNRKLKAECGLTLGQVRSRLRLRRAQALLVQGMPIQTVGERIHILDSNYFTRWFRQQTGQTPTQWKKQPRNSERL